MNDNIKYESKLFLLELSLLENKFSSGELYGVNEQLINENNDSINQSKRLKKKHFLPFVCKIQKKHADKQNLLPSYAIHIIDNVIQHTNELVILLKIQAPTTSFIACFEWL